MLYNITNNQLRRSVRKGDMRDFAFLTLKRGYPFPIFPSNWIGKFKFGILTWWRLWICLLGVWIFLPHCISSQAWKSCYFYFYCFLNSSLVSQPSSFLLQLSKEIGICYVDFAQALDKPFDGVNFLTSLQPLTLISD